MHALPRRAAVALAAAALGASAAQAQLPANPFSLGISGGAAIPTGDAGDAFETGFSVDGIIGIRAPLLPVSFRGEVGYTRFGVKNIDDVNLRMISGVANAVYTFSAGPVAVVRPYLIGGIGAYNLKATGDNVPDDSDNETKVGLNGGVGIEIPLSGITGFGEIRYTSVFTEGTNTNFVPIRFGIRF